MAFKFEKLQGWQRALNLSEYIYRLTLKFPKDELYILTSQMKRAADSPGLNNAEGSTGQCNAEFGRFIGYSLRSNIERVGCLHIGKQRGLITDVEFQNCNKGFGIDINDVARAKKKLTLIFP